MMTHVYERHVEAPSHRVEGLRFRVSVVYGSGLVFKFRIVRYRIIIYFENLIYVNVVRFSGVHDSYITHGFRF